MDLELKKKKREKEGLVKDLLINLLVCIFLKRESKKSRKMNEWREGGRGGWRNGKKKSSKIICGLKNNNLETFMSLFP